jgi:hypothetical protein
MLALMERGGEVEIGCVCVCVLGFGYDFDQGVREGGRNSVDLEYL